MAPTYLLSAIIMKGQGPQDTRFQNLDGVPRDVLLGISPNGWGRSFGPESETEKKAAGQWKMFIFQTCLSTWLYYKVLLPPPSYHSFFFSQPLNVSLFAPLKSAYSSILRRSD